MDITLETGAVQVNEQGEQVQEIRRGEKGHFLPGQSPNPGGRPKKSQEEAEALEMIRVATPEAVTILLGLLKAKSGVSALTKVKIIEMMLDRTFGKPDTAVRVTTELPTVEEAQAELEAIFGTMPEASEGGVVH